MKIYVASSWRNVYQPSVIKELREDKHEVYDFRQDGFHWSFIDKQWKSWNYDQFIKALDTEQANKGFDRDFNAMRNADACVLVLPCGRSAHLEAGYFVGANKPLLIYCPLFDMPDLMYKMTVYNFNKLSAVRKYLRLL